MSKPKSPESEILALFSHYQNVSQTLADLRAQAREAEKTLNAAESALSALIPAGKSRAGIAHIQREQKNPPAYARILSEAISQKLIPATRLAELEQIKSNLTTTRLVDEFKSTEA